MPGDGAQNVFADKVCDIGADLIRCVRQILSSGSSIDAKTGQVCRCLHWGIIDSVMWLLKLAQLLGSCHFVQVDNCLVPLALIY